MINNCPPGDITCDRIHVSGNFFQSPEFQQRGYFVYRFYPVSFGRKPDYAESTDLAKVSGFLSEAELEAAKQAFIAELCRPAFASTYNGLTSTQYVDTLLATAGVTSPNRDFWIAALGNGTRTRAQVLREIAESLEVYNKYYNEAFVVMQYFGYLRRHPDALFTAPGDAALRGLMARAAETATVSYDPNCRPALMGKPADVLAGCARAARGWPMSSRSARRTWSG